jgi:hypothetical protein
MTGPNDGQSDGGRGGLTAVLVFSWLLVGIPLAWGVVQTLGKAASLFK